MYAHPKNSKHLLSHSRAIMALDHSRLGLENKFLENKSGRIFLPSTGLLFTNSCQQIWGCVNQPFMLFIHHIWGETVLFIIQTSDRMRHFTIFQCSGRSILGFYRNHSKNFQNHPYGQPVLIFSASCQCDRVFEWTLMEIRFNIITNLLSLFFVT